MRPTPTASATTTRWWPCSSGASRTKPSAHWLDALEAAGIPAGPVLEFDEAMADPHIVARGMVVETEHPAAGTFKTLGIPVKLSDTPGALRRPAPRLGEHTAEVLEPLAAQDQQRNGRRRTLSPRHLARTRAFRAQGGAPSMDKPWMVYGANGYTGELIAREAARRGLKPILAGRSPGKIAPLASELGLEARVFDLGDVAPQTAAALEGVSLVLHCAGPFSATSAPMIAACLRAHAHYFDITGEISVFEHAMGRMRWRAQQASSCVLGWGSTSFPPTASPPP